MEPLSRTVLIANRGVIAHRVLRSCRKLGWRAVMVCSEADQETEPVLAADQAITVGPAPPASSYLDAAKILNAARNAGASILHPGYGFLSENADFCELCEAERISFAGPTPDQMRVFGLKHTARDKAKACGVPLLPGTNLLESEAEARAAAEEIGFPVILKSAAGGGGIGMKVCRNEVELSAAYESVRRMGEANFRHDGVFLEKFVERARHIEVQIFGDGHGRVLALGERDCSVQRRNQKVIEETPAPGLREAVRSALHAAAKKMGQAVSYRSAGTVEFLLDAETQDFYFLEVNTRLQVEHGVTEEVYGVDLVEWMLKLAAGDLSFFPETTPVRRGTSIQARLYAEIPAKDFQPSTGLITRAVFPSDLRVETWVADGTEVTPYYDPMLAKVISKGSTRREALDSLLRGLQQTNIHGVETNRDYLLTILETPEFQTGGVCTGFLKALPFEARLAEVIESGIETLVVDWPGRTGYWEVGVPPSGPFDDQSFRAANRLLGNPEGLPGLEITLQGPTIRFLHGAWCSLCGAPSQATLETEPVTWGKPFFASAGAVLRVGPLPGPGMRSYLAVRGGIDVPKYLGSATTFRLGKFGGHGGRALRAGDFLRLNPGCETLPTNNLPRTVWNGAQSWDNHWEIGVSYGPHGAPDFFTERDIDRFFTTDWQVHYNSARTGVRLIGPKPEWARPDGGEAGLHPSNIHDNAYQVGAIDFTGDMPIILGPDGPSLGGFVCPAIVLSGELWKVGQLRPGDRVRFRPVALAAKIPEEGIRALPEVCEPVKLFERSDVVIRRQGDTGVLVEFGPMTLDLTLRFRVQALCLALKSSGMKGLLDLTPGIRSLQVRYDSSQLSLQRLLVLLEEQTENLGQLENLTVPSRVVRLPLSWDDPATQLAISKYMQSVRADAPWCPSNIEFIRRINGLDSVEDVRRIVFEAEYLVMGLGDVYLGAPVATPLDPRHRLVTTKYNPARTWTPENAVGIGGAYLCIYGMEGPGGYQFVGRTVPVWNTFRQTRSFRNGQPWLLRFFDRIRFYQVSAEELLKLRADILTGKFEPPIEDDKFSLAQYQSFLEREAEGIEMFRKKQRAAFEAERQRWNALGQNVVSAAEELSNKPAEIDIPVGKPVSATAAGSIWKVLVEEGGCVTVGEVVAILESMKMEIPIQAPCAGVVKKVLIAEGCPVTPGQVILVLDT